MSRPIRCERSDDGSRSYVYMDAAGREFRVWRSELGDWLHSKSFRFFRTRADAVEDGVRPPGS